jgi:hypothetical protein
MVSRIYRSVTIVALLLLAQAALLSPAKKTNSSRGEREELYNKLIQALGSQRYIKTNITELEESSKCPFRVLNFKGYTRVVCDFDYCSEMKYNWCHNCKQVYMRAKDISPKRCAKMNGLETVADVEFGCIYSPKQSNQSKETTEPGPAVH